MFKNSMQILSLLCACWVGSGFGIIEPDIIRCTNFQQCWPSRDEVITQQPLENITITAKDVAGREHTFILPPVSPSHCVLRKLVVASLQGEGLMNNEERAFTCLSFKKGTTDLNCWNFRALIKSGDTILVGITGREQPRQPQPGLRLGIALEYLF